MFLSVVTGTLHVLSKSAILSPAGILLRRPLPAQLATSRRSVRKLSSMVQAQQGRGALIVFEGGDRCGKTTQTSRLVHSLRDSGVKAELLRFPDRKTAIGEMINSYLCSKEETDDAAIHLLFSANRWEKREAMLSALADGTTLVLDRYSYSGVAFTAAKGIPTLDLEWCKAPEVGLPAPDALIYLDINEEEAAARGGFGDERYETTVMQRAVREQFAALRDDTWRVIDARQDVDAVAAQVKEIAMAAVTICGEGGVPVKTLWSGEPVQR